VLKRCSFYLLVATHCNLQSKNLNRTSIESGGTLMSSRSLVPQSMPLPVRMPHRSPPHTASRAYAAGRAFSRVVWVVRFVFKFAIFVVRLIAYVLARLRLFAVIAWIAMIGAMGVEALMYAPPTQIHGPATATGSNTGRGLVRASTIDQPQDTRAAPPARYFDGTSAEISHASPLLLRPQAPNIAPSLPYPSAAPLPLQHTSTLPLPPPSPSAHVPASAPRFRFKL
jgi:hypothetical protein